MATKRQVRHGYMSFVNKIANLIVGQSAIDDLKLPETEAWCTFIDNEVKESNKRDAIKLGGVSKPDRNLTSDDEDAVMDVNMENIMARFNSYS